MAVSRVVAAVRGFHIRKCVSASPGQKSDLDNDMILTKGFTVIASIYLLQYHSKNKQKKAEFLL